MRVAWPVVALAFAGGALAATRAPAAPARGEVLVSTAAPWRWQVIAAPRLAPQIGALAVSGLDVVAARAAQPIAVLGDGDPPSRWPYAVDGDGRAIPRPSATERIAVAYGVTTFTLGAEAQGLAMLELRVRYQDGVAAWLNGVEIARRALPRDGDGAATALAARPHGPEWETFYVPVGPHVLYLGENTLAIELHPSGRRLAPQLVEAELIGRRDRGIVRGPVLAEVAATTARIAVATDPDTEAVLEWGTGDALDRRQASAAGARHTFALVGLPARAQVRYRVRAGASVTSVYAFHTMPAAGDVVRIGVYGDVRGGHAVHRRLVDAMLAEPLDAVGVTGDMVLRGGDEGDWQRFFAITAPLLAQVPYLPVVGNHDLGWGGAKRPDATFALPSGPPDRPPGAYWYSRDVADVHLVFLDSNAYDRSEQLGWLERDLAAARARGVRAILAFTHDGPYSRGYHRGNLDARTRYVPVLARHGVDLVLAGHDHLYQRGEIDGVRYVVSGGGGASLYAISCGVPGKRRCKVADGMQAIAREHHFLVITISPASLEVCPRRPDGRLLERCTRYPLRVIPRASASP